MRWAARVLLRKRGRLSVASLSWPRTFATSFACEWASGLDNWRAKSKVKLAFRRLIGARAKKKSSLLDRQASSKLNLLLLFYFQLLQPNLRPHYKSSYACASYYLYFSQASKRIVWIFGRNRWPPSYWVHFWRPPKTWPSLRQRVPKQRWSPPDFGPPQKTSNKCQWLVRLASRHCLASARFQVFLCTQRKARIRGRTQQAESSNSPTICPLLSHLLAPTSKTPYKVVRRRGAWSWCRIFWPHSTRQVQCFASHTLPPRICCQPLDATPSTKPAKGLWVRHHPPCLSSRRSRMRSRVKSDKSQLCRWIAPTSRSA